MPAFNLFLTRTFLIFILFIFFFFFFFIYFIFLLFFIYFFLFIYLFFSILGWDRLGFLVEVSCNFDDSSKLDIRLMYISNNASEGR